MNWLCPCPPLPYFAAPYWLVFPPFPPLSLSSKRRTEVVAFPSPPTPNRVSAPFLAVASVVVSVFAATSVVIVAFVAISVAAFFLLLLLVFLLLMLCCCSCCWCCTSSGRSCGCCCCCPSCWDRGRASLLSTFHTSLPPPFRHCRGLARVCFRCCCCRTRLWRHVLTGARLRHMSRGTTRPAVGSAAFHHHHHQQHLFFPAHQYIGDLCKIPAGRCLLEHKVLGGNARFTNYDRDLLKLSLLGEKGPHPLFADIMTINSGKSNDWLLE